MTPEAKRLSEALLRDVRADLEDWVASFDLGSCEPAIEHSKSLIARIDDALSLPDQPDAARAGVRELDDDQIMEIIKEVAPWRDEPKLNDLLTYEKSPPLFPQATYDVPSYRATKFVRAVERRILSALVPEPSPAQADGLRAAIQWVEKRRDDYVAEHGSYDPETGATEFPGNGDEYVGELEEIIEGLEALRPAPKQFLATEDGEFNGNAPAQADDRGLLNICEADMKVSFVGDCPRATRSTSMQEGRT